MKNRIAVGAVLGVLGLVLLAWLPPLPAASRKASPQRITAVNTVRSVSLTMTNAGAMPAAQPGGSR